MKVGGLRGTNHHGFSKLGGLRGTATDVRAGRDAHGLPGSGFAVSVDRQRAIIFPVTAPDVLLVGPIGDGLRGAPAPRRWLWTNHGEGARSGWCGGTSSHISTETG